MAVIKEIVRLFFLIGWKRQLLLLLVMIAGVIAENFSIASLWPIFNTISNASQSTTPVSQAILALLNSVGLKPSLGVLLTFLCCAAAIKFALSTSGIVYVGRELSALITRLRLDLVEAITESRWSYIISIPSGRLMSALSEEADRAGRALGGANRFAIKAVETLAYLTATLWVSWQFSLAAVLITAILWIAASRYIRQARRAGRKKWTSTHRLSSAVEEMLSSMKSLRAMNRHGFLGRFASGQISKLRRSVESEYYSESAIRAVQEPLLAIMMIAGFYVGHRYFNLGLVELVATAWLLNRIASGVAGMREAMQKVAVDGFALWAMIDLTDAMKGHAEILHGGKDVLLKHQCRYEEVSFRYGAKVITEQASADLPVGEVTTLIGPSGSGKTTIADLLVGLHEPESGRILVDGVPLDEVDLVAWRSRLGYIPQDNILFNDSVYENVALGDPAIGEEQVIEALKLAGAWDFVSRLPGGIHEAIGVRGNLLSGGQKQRLSIARALVYRPQLLVLDEATSALDLATASEICKSVRGLRGDRTVLAITHQAIWTEAADQVLELNDGKLRASRVG